MLNVGKTHDTVRVVNDQIGTPTYTYDLAKLLCDMIVTDRYGYYHATNAELAEAGVCSCSKAAKGSSSDSCGGNAPAGYISWYDFACEIFRQAGYSTKVIPVTTEEYGLSKAARPANSRLDKSKLTENGFKRLPEWKDALGRYLKEIQY